MKYIINLFKTFFVNRGVPFYIGLGAAVISLSAAICYGACLNGLDQRFLSWAVIFLPLLGALLYLVFALFKKTRVGAIVMTALNFVSLIVFIVTIYEYPLEQVMVISNIMDIPYMVSIIFVAVIYIIATVLSNVVSYLPLDKESKDIKENN